MLNKQQCHVKEPSTIINTPTFYHVGECASTGVKFTEKEFDTSSVQML